MKNRARIITAFLLCACLLVGVGYAQINGQLIIGGNARFNGQSELTSEVKEAVIFSNAVPNDGNCISASITDNAKKTADMTVVINDAVGVADTFSASATYTITYDTEEAYPEVSFGVPTPTITSVNSLTGWTITAVFQNPVGEASVSEGVATLAPGASIDVVVTVMYNNNSTGEVFKGTDNATISVPLNYVTVND